MPCARAAPASLDTGRNLLPRQCNQADHYRPGACSTYIDAYIIDRSACTLTQASLAIDRGVNAGMSSDFFGALRPQGGGFDIGYAESPFTAAITGLTVQNISPSVLANATFLTASVTGSNNIAYVWSFGNGIATAGALTHCTYPVLGTYTATVTATNDKGSTSATTLVTVTNSIPTAKKVYMPLLMKDRTQR